MTTTTNNHGKPNESGFSLIELSVALLFVAFIMVFLITTLLSIMKTYNKGVWLSQINQAGRQINADIGAQARFSSEATYLPDQNRLCMGGVSYLWNINKKTIVNWFNEEGSARPSATALRLVRIADASGAYCASSSKLPMPSRTDSAVTILLGPGALVQEFTVASSNATNLTSLTAVFSTDGDNQPQKVGGSWQCGDVQPDGSFKADNNQYCAFININLVVFRRGQQ